MAASIFIRPAPGLLVLGPDGQRLPEEGATVPDDSFWRRRLAKGDVVAAAAPVKE